MSQLADIEYVVVNHTSTDNEAGALFLDIINALHWEVENVNTVQDAIDFLNRER
jgi:hypothetical protein